MRYFCLFCFLALLGLTLVACGTGDTSVPKPGAAVPAAVKIVAPASTAEPARERPYRSYPAPTGYPGFRRYYQKRCYPGCHYYPTAPGPDDVPATPTIDASTAGRERPYRSYPAPTGYPGFRRYYQKRCYPGCHYYPSAPAPTKVHP